MTCTEATHFHFRSKGLGYFQPTVMQSCCQKLHSCLRKNIIHIIRTLNEQTMVHKFFKPLKNERPCPPISQKAFCPLLNLQSDPSPTSNSKNVKKEDSFCLPVCHFGNLIQLTLNFYFRLLSGSQASQKGGCRVKDPLQKKKVLSLQAK